VSKKKKLEEQLKDEFALLQKAWQTGARLHATVNPAIDSELRTATNQIESEFKTTVQREESELQKVRRATSTTIQMAIAAPDVGIAAWTSPGWATHLVPQTGQPPTLLRLGELIVGHMQAKLPSMPAMLPLIGSRHALVSSSESASQISASVLESLAWRLVALSSPETYRFVLFDPLGHGASLASLLRLPESIRGLKVLSQAVEMEQALQGLVDEISEINQRRLINIFTDLEAYNSANPNLALPYRILVVAGFPRSFTARSCELLLEIARSGPRVGCYLLASVLKGENVPHGFNFTTLMNLSSYLTIQPDGQITWNDNDFAQFPIVPDPTPAPRLIDQLVAKIQLRVAAVASKVFAFREIAVRKARWWQESTADGLELALGLDESGKSYSLTIGQGVAHHLLVGGTIGSGKTNLLHLLVLMLCTRYSPEELEIYLVDFKEGVEFQDYVTFDLPHAMAVVVEAEREFGLSILQRLVIEMEERSQAFKGAGVSDLPAFRSRGGKPLARIVLIMDEFVKLLSEEDDRVTQQAGDALKALAQRGRAFGIHLVLSAQRPTSQFVSMGEIKSQISVRLALKCRTEDSTLILGEGNEQAANLSKSGEAFVTIDPDHVDASHRVRIARLDPDDRSLYLRGLREFARLRSYQRKSPMIVFSRDMPISLFDCPPVERRLAAPRWPLLSTPTLWLGQPLRIAEAISVSLESRATANMLVLGNNEALAVPVIMNGLISLAITLPPLTTRIVFIGDLDPQQAVGEVLDSMLAALQYLKNVARTAGVDMVSQLVVELDQRLSVLPTKPKSTIFIIVAGLQRWSEARASGPYGGPTPLGTNLARLWKEGPEVGIHTVMWCDRPSALEAVVGASARYEALISFGHRVALQMPSDDSVNFLGNPQAARLGSARAYYRNESWPAGQQDQFKPYDLPSAAQLRSLLSAAQTRWL